MSKTFDEGGAKGLLLVNLGVGANGCNIVFDSKEEAASIAQDEEKEDEITIRGREEGMIDISSLNIKLESMLGGASIESIPLVPQLRSLREEYGQLESEGFVDHNAPKTKVCLRVRGIAGLYCVYANPICCLPTPVSSLCRFPRRGNGGGDVHSPRCP